MNLKNKITDDRRTRPLVSILIVTRNRSKLLPRAIKSALQQTYKNFELLVIDGASEDDTRQVVSEFSRLDERVKYIEFVNSPAHVCFNFGLSIAQGEYIAQLDDDDEFYPLKLEKQVQIMEEGDERLGFVYCWEEYWDDKNKEVVSELKNTHKGDIYRELLEKDGAGGGSVMLIRKEALLKIGGYDVSIETISDLQLRLNLAKYYHFDFVPEILVRTHVNHIYQRLTGHINYKAVIELHRKILLDHQDAYKIYPEKSINHFISIFNYALNGKDISQVLFVIIQIMRLNTSLVIKFKYFSKIIYEFQRRFLNKYCLK